MTSENVIVAKHGLRLHLERLLSDREVFHKRPTERLAAMIAAQLISQDRHSPWSLCVTLAQIDELRGRLLAAKVWTSVHCAFGSSGLKRQRAGQ